MSDDARPGGNIPLNDPPTVLPIAKKNKTRGFTFRTEFDKWKTETNLSLGDRSVYEAEAN